MAYASPFRYRVSIEPVEASALGRVKDDFSRTVMNRNDRYGVTVSETKKGDRHGVHHGQGHGTG